MLPARCRSLPFLGGRGGRMIKQQSLQWSWRAQTAPCSSGGGGRGGGGNLRGNISCVALSPMHAAARGVVVARASRGRWSSVRMQGPSSSSSRAAATAALPAVGALGIHSNGLSEALLVHLRASKGMMMRVALPAAGGLPVVLSRGHAANRTVRSMAAAAQEGYGQRDNNSAEEEEEEEVQQGKTMPEVVVLASSGKHDELLQDLLRRRVAAEYGSADDDGGERTRQLSPCQDLGVAIFAAAAKGHASSLECLLRYASSSIPLAVTNSDREDDVVDAFKGQTALMSAARMGHVECVRLLLQHGDPEAQVLAVDKYGWNALMWAADAVPSDKAEPLRECVRMLLEHQPEKQLAGEDAGGDNALQLAIESEHFGCIEAILRSQLQGPSSSSSSSSDDLNDLQGEVLLRMMLVLRRATRQPHPGCVAALLARYPDIKGKDEALQCAAQELHRILQEPLKPWTPTASSSSSVFSKSRKKGGGGGGSSSSSSSSSGIGSSGSSGVGGSEEEREAKVIGLKDCMVLLLAEGALLPPRASDKEVEVVRPIIRDAVRQCLT